MCLLDARKSSQFESELKEKYFFKPRKSHFHEFHEISWNYFILRKLPENDQDSPKFGRFPSEWKSQRGSSRRHSSWIMHDEGSWILFMSVCCFFDLAGEFGADDDRKMPHLVESRIPHPPGAVAPSDRGPHNRRCSLKIALIPPLRTPRVALRYYYRGMLKCLLLVESRSYMTCDAPCNTPGYRVVCRHLASTRSKVM